MPKPELTVTHYNAGDTIGPMAVAGESMDVCEAFGIRADVFDVAGEVRIPLIESDTRGSGQLDAFLGLVESHYGRRPVFVNVINGRLFHHLKEAGYQCIDVDELADPPTPEGA